MMQAGRCPLADFGPGPQQPRWAAALGGDRDPGPVGLGHIPRNAEDLIMLMFGFADQRAPGPNPQSTAPNPELDDEFLDEEESVGDEISETLVALMPWGISILFHVALVVAAFFFVWQVILVEEEQEPIIPDASFSETPGAPDPIETVQEESSDSPRTTPTVDPTVNTPNPTVNNTNIVSQSIGMTHAGGISGAASWQRNGTRRCKLATATCLSSRGLRNTTRPCAANSFLASSWCPIS